MRWNHKLLLLKFPFALSDKYPLLLCDLQKTLSNLKINATKTGKSYFKKPTTVVLWHKNEYILKSDAHSCKILLTITKTRCWGWLDHNEEARPDKNMSLKSP